MHRKLKTNIGNRKNVAPIRKRVWDRRAITKCALIVAACACSPYARGQSASPPQIPLTVESPQEMQARISKLEAEVSELKAIVSRLQPRLSTADAAVPVTAAVQPAAVIQQTPKQETVQTVL